MHIHACSFEGLFIEVAFFYGARKVYFIFIEKEGRRNSLLLIPIDADGKHRKRGPHRHQYLTLKANTSTINISLAFPGRVLWTNDAPKSLAIKLGLVSSRA